MAIVKKVLSGLGSIKTWVAENFTKIGHKHSATEVTVEKSTLTNNGSVQSHVELLTGRVNTNANSIDYLNGEVSTLHKEVAQRSKVGHTHTLPATNVNVAGNNTVSAATVQAHIEHLTTNKSDINHTHSIYAAKSHTHLLILGVYVAIVVTSGYAANGSLTCTNSGWVIIDAGVGFGTYSITKNKTVVESGTYDSTKQYSVQVSKGDVIAFNMFGQGAGTPIGTWGLMVNVGFGDTV